MFDRCLLTRLSIFCPYTTSRMFKWLTPMLCRCLLTRLSIFCPYTISRPSKWLTPMLCIYYPILLNILPFPGAAPTASIKPAAHILPRKSCSGSICAGILPSPLTVSDLSQPLWLFSLHLPEPLDVHAFIYWNQHCEQHRFHASYGDFGQFNTCYMLLAMPAHQIIYLLSLHHIKTAQMTDAHVQ